MSIKVTILSNTDWAFHNIIDIKCPICGKNTKGHLDDGDGYYHRSLEERKYTLKGGCYGRDLCDFLHNWELEVSIKNVKLEFDIEF